METIELIEGKIDVQMADHHIMIKHEQMDKIHLEIDWINLDQMTFEMDMYMYDIDIPLDRENDPDKK